MFSCKPGFKSIVQQPLIWFKQGLAWLTLGAREHSPNLVWLSLPVVKALSFPSGNKYFLGGSNYCEVKQTNLELCGL